MPEEAERQGMSLFDAVYTLRSIRRFRRDPVPVAVVRHLIEAATRAANGGNAQTWRFVVVADPALRAAVGDVYRRSFADVYPYPPQPDPRRERLWKKAYHLAEHMGDEPPILIVVCLERTAGSPPPTGTGAITFGSSAYPAVQNLMLAARAYGLGTCLTTIHRAREAELRVALGIPEHVETMALIPLGHPAEQFGSLTRRPVEEVSYWDRWGAPFAVAAPAD
ncbi:MAG: nitroreductase family protein [Chloroflexi bacterium]|nr:nitroreductase family protein [Chloroflexota bacterium]